MRRLVPLLCLVTALLAACSDDGSSDNGSTEGAPATAPIGQSTPTSTTPTSTTPPPASSVAPPTTTGEDPTPSTTAGSTGPGPSGASVHLPAEPAGAPVVVLVHGGGWVAGSPVSMEPLAEAAASRGAVVVNASYRTGRDGGGYPGSFDDVACAVRFARAHAADLGATGPLILAGHSAGAHLSAVVALSEDRFGVGCAWEGTSTPDTLVGLAGIYQLDAVAPVMDFFLGGDRTAAPEAWEAADPYAHLPAGTAFETLLVHGLGDRIVPAESSEAFAQALGDVGADALVRLVEGGHNDVIDPDLVGDLVVDGVAVGR